VGLTRFVAGLMVLAAPLATAATPLTVLPVTPAQRDVPVSAARAQAAASDLSFEAGCSPTVPGLGLVALSWRPGAAAGGEQRVDLSKFPEGFASGRYEVSAALEPGVSAGTLERLEPGVNYYWRVLRRKGAVWVASETGRVEAPTCPVDRVIEAHES